MMNSDEVYMRRCIGLARNGVQSVQPNPMVGAVVVCDGRIVGEGYHVRCGEAHAEVNAIRSVREPELLRRSTLYVSLEPCAHHGKTPPCADLIVACGIPRVVVGCTDPFSQVAGRGIRRLREAGCEVTVGVLERECRQLVRAFVTYHTLRRPYVTLKWAQSADGFIDVLRSGGSPVRLSSSLTELAVHKRRARSAAILVGSRTALLDNPSLTVRHWQGKHPVRVVWAGDTVLPTHLHLLDGTVPTLVFTACHPAGEHGGVTYIAFPAGADRLSFLLEELYRRGLQTLLVEGGRRVLQSFIDSHAWDEAFVEQAPLLLEAGVEAPHLSGNHSLEVRRSFGRPVLHYLNTWRGEQ